MSDQANETNSNSGVSCTDDAAVEHVKTGSPEVIIITMSTLIYIIQVSSPGHSSNGDDCCCQAKRILGDELPHHCYLRRNNTTGRAWPGERGVEGVFWFLTDSKHSKAHTYSKIGGFRTKIKACGLRTLEKSLTHRRGYELLK